MKNEDWEIPPNLQPDPDDYAFDLDRALGAVVNLKTFIPADAFTAGTLGTERAGSGVVIRDERAGRHHRLPDHRGGDDLDHLRRRPRGAGPRAGL